MKALSVAAASVALLLTACVPPEQPNDVIRRFDPEETVMGEIQDRGELIVGVENQMAPLADLAEAGRLAPSCCVGLTVELGKEIGRALGVDVLFVAGSTSELLAMPDAGDADVVFPAEPVTERLVRQHAGAITNPYFVAHQRLAVRASGISDVSHLAGRSACTFADPITGVRLADLEPTIDEIVSTPEGCLEMIRAGDVEAITGPDVLLAGLIAQEPTLTITGDELSTEAYSAVVEKKASGWVTFVEANMEEAQEEGRWLNWFEEFIGPHFDETREPPALTVEEAAALFPADLP